VARNLGNGRTIVFIRPSPGLIRGAGWAALWNGHQPATGKAAFWSLYAKLLVARARDEGGQPNFEANKVTKLYEEIIQAARGSRWVWALTFASSIEGLAKLLFRRVKSVAIPIPRVSTNWSRTSTSGQVPAVSAVHRTAEITTIHILRELKTSGVVTADQLSAWTEIRNSVMHGNLVSPYSSEEEDGKLLALAAMMHALTSEILRRSV
jgi:hypothetical protein